MIVQRQMLVNAWLSGVGEMAGDSEAVFEGAQQAVVGESRGSSGPA